MQFLLPNFSRQGNPHISPYPLYLSYRYWAFMRAGSEKFLHNDIPLQSLLMALPQRKFIMTNCAEKQAKEALDVLGVTDLFEKVHSYHHHSSSSSSSSSLLSSLSFSFPGPAYRYMEQTLWVTYVNQRRLHFRW